MQSFSDWNAKRSCRTKNFNANNNEISKSSPIQLSKLIISPLEAAAPINASLNDQQPIESNIINIFDRICHLQELDDIYWWSSLTDNFNNDIQQSLIHIRSIERRDDELLYLNCENNLLFILNPLWLWDQIHSLHRPLKRILIGQYRDDEKATLEDFINLIIKEIHSNPRILPLIEHGNIIRRFQII